MRKTTPSKITEKFASFTVKYRWPMAILFIVLSVACAVAIPFIKIVYDVSSYLPDESTSAVGLNILKEEFDDKGMTYVILPDVTPTEAKEIAGVFAETEGVANVIFEENTSYNKETSAALLTISFTDYDSTQECFSTMERLIETGKPYNATFVGQSASSYYTKLETEESILKIGVVIVAIIIVMLIVTSKSYFEIVPMLLNFGVAVLLNMGTNVFFNGISYISNLVSLVLQLALSIDYSVILMHRYMEEIGNGLSPKEAAVAAQTKGIPEILSSSLTTIAGMAALMFMTLGIGVEIGLALTKGIVFSLLTVIFLMPAL
ncbi:MAG: MMPL family transporter, partial [Clostridia bacterium]|nr:MMPL family transporter [Clostridia bacterium]